MRLADFITDNREAILRDFEDFARSSTAVGKPMKVAELRDHAAEMLEAIAVDLGQPQTASAQKRKSFGDAAVDPDAPTTPAQHHGYERRTSDFTIDEAVAEFRALRASVLRLWTEAMGAPPDGDAVQDMMRFNEAIDQALAESTARFSLEDERVHREREAEAEARRRTAEQANRLKSDLLRMVSHELRTPLNTMCGVTANLLQGVHGAVPEDQRGALVRVAKSGEHLLRVIDDLLDAKGIAEGSIVFQTEDLAMGELLTELPPLLEPLAQEANVELCVQTGRGEVVVRADPDRLYQVLLNLVSNAVRFTPRGGQVWVTCEEGDAEVSVCVRDTGRGIPEDKLEAIFEPFVQLDEGTTREHGGSGLGLTISRNLTRGMGGDLSVKSELGRGSVFRVDLPKGGGKRGRVENRGR